MTRIYCCDTHLLQDMRCAGELKTLSLLFDTRNNDEQNVRRANILPLVGEALTRIKLEERYRLHLNRDRVNPAIGLVVADNLLWKAGMHFSWTFYEIVNITDQGRIMVIEREKLFVKGK